MRLNAVDAACTRLALAGEALGARVSWRLARALHGAAVVLHDAGLRSAVALRIPYVPHAWIDRSAAAPASAAPAYYTSPTLLHRDAGERLSELRRGFWTPDRGAPFSLRESAWSGREEAGRSMQVRFLWHLLHPVAILLQGHRERSDGQDLARAFALADRWRRTCLYRERDATVWDDHITAMRALVLCDLWNEVRRGESVPRAELRLLGAAMARHAEKMALERVYRPEHNHGITQGYALLVVATSLPAHPSAAAWARLGLGRLESQMAENVSPEGVHREHSPYYHFFVLRQFLAAARLARAEGLPMSPEYRDRLHRMIAAGASMIQPNGMLAPLGDTWSGAPILVTPEELEGVPPEVSAPLRFAISAGAEGPRLESAIYPGGGLAVLRSGPNAEEPVADERHVTVRLSVFPTSHIHSDALSMTLYAYGSELLVDSGGPYGYGDPFRRRYFTATAAHNTVAVDSASQSPGPSRVRRWEVNSGCATLEAEHENYPGVLHRRTLFFIRRRYVLLVDRLESPTGHRYTQRFHIAPDLSLHSEAGEAVARGEGGGASLRIVPLLRGGGAVSLEQGGEDPARGWVCSGDLERTPAWVASYSASGERALFATLLVPAPGRTPPDVTTIELSPAMPGETRVEIAVEEVRLRLRVRGDGTCELAEAGA